jgi:hypothetical protein
VKEVEYKVIFLRMWNMRDDVVGGGLIMDKQTQQNFSCFFFPAASKSTSPRAKAALSKPSARPLTSSGGKGEGGCPQVITVKKRPFDFNTSIETKAQIQCIGIPTQGTEARAADVRSLIRHRLTGAIDLQGHRTRSRQASRAV